MSLYSKIKSIYPHLVDADFLSSIRLQDDGSGPYIAKWDYPGLPKPTQEQLDAAEAVADLRPDIKGFQQDIKSVLGGIVAANTLIKKYPLFLEALSQLHWSDVETLINDAKQTGAITSQQFAAIKAAAIANHIPISL